MYVNDQTVKIHFCVSHNIRHISPLPAVLNIYCVAKEEHPLAAYGLHTHPTIVHQSITNICA